MSLTVSESGRPPWLMRLGRLWYVLCGVAVIYGLLSGLLWYVLGVGLWMTLLLNLLAVLGFGLALVVAAALVIPLRIRPAPRSIAVTVLAAAALAAAWLHLPDWRLWGFELDRQAYQAVVDEVRSGRLAVPISSSAFGHDQPIPRPAWAWERSWSVAARNDGPRELVWFSQHSGGFAQTCGYLWSSSGEPSSHAFDQGAGWPARLGYSQIGPHWFYLCALYD